ALDRLDGGWPGDDDPGYDDAPGYNDPHPSLLGLSGEDGELAELDEPAVAEALEAGVTHRYRGTGTGFAAGGPRDVRRPGPDLAWHIGLARQAGLGVLSDDELIGVLGAARRLGSWQAELELAAVAELDARRADPDGRDSRGGPGGREGEY